MNRKRNAAPEALVNVAIDAERSILLLPLKVSASQDELPVPVRVQLVRTASGEVLLEVPLEDATPASVRAAVGAIMRMRARFSISASAAAEIAPLTTLEEAVLDKNALRAFADKYDNPAPFAFLPLRADRHPDGSLRLVWIRVAVPEGFQEPLEPKEIRSGVGSLHQSTMSAGLVATRGEQHDLVRIGPIDPAPEWREVASYRIRPKADDSHSSITMHETLDMAEERSGYKQPAKLREVKRQHWRNVAHYLWRRWPVAAEVMQDYPDLAQFYASDIAAAQTLAEKRVEIEAQDNPENPDVTVEWSAQTGMLIHTRGKDPAVIAAIKGLRGSWSGSFRWSRTMGCWFRPQSVGVSESTIDIDRVAGGLRKAGLTVAVDRGVVGTLGDANVRRQAHKFWRAERYAQGGEKALEKATGFEERAGSIRSDLPVGAPTARAERAEARAERAEGKAEGELEYAEHAASVSENLAAVAAGYETTATITRREAEKRADAFAGIFVRRAKADTGSVRLASSKTDNLSAYVLSWVVVYPPIAEVVGFVSYDGMVIEASSTKTTHGGSLAEGYIDARSLAARAKTLKNAYRENVTGLDAQAVYERVVQALPKFVNTPVATRLAVDPEIFIYDLAVYAGKRGAKVSAAAGKSVQVRAARNWGDVVRKGIDYFGPWYHEHHYMLRHLEGLTFRFIETKPPRANQPYETLFSADVDFTGMSIEQAFEVFLAGTRAMFTHTPLVMPALRKPARAPATTAPQSIAAERSGISGVEQRDAAMESAQARRVELGAASHSVSAEARTRLRSLQATAEAVTAHQQQVDRARGEGHTAGYYPTPPTLAQSMVDAAEIRAGEYVLEPSAGMGALVEELLKRGARVDAIEFNPARRAYLEAAYEGRANILFDADFLSFAPRPIYDAVVLNPPFAAFGVRQIDAAHVEHALKFVRPGGRLVALMSPGSVNASSGRRRAALHQALQGLGFSTQWMPVASGRFRISGTDTPTVMLVAQAPKANQARHRR